jgi:hypothetical protein
MDLAAGAMDLAPLTLREDTDLAPLTLREGTDLAPLTLREDTDLAPLTLREDTDLAPLTLREGTDLALLTLRAVMEGTARSQPREEPGDRLPVSEAVADTRARMSLEQSRGELAAQRRDHGRLPAFLCTAHS